MKRRTFLAGLSAPVCLAGLLNGRTRWEAHRPETSRIETGPVVATETVAEGFDQPIGFATAPVPSGYYVADKTGRVYLHEAGATREEPFLDVRDRLMESTSWEQGLIGFELHPEFADTRRFYVRYSAPRRPGTPADYDHTFVLSEFTATADYRGTVPDSERTILEIPQPGRNHNAGAIAFGPDGYLYVATGDGKHGNGDQGRGHATDWYALNGGGNGQDVTENLLGSILRIDVDARDDEEPYAIPPDNPLVGRDGLDEQYAWGFRNPYRMSFDGDDLYVGDVGQDQFEEINLVRRGGNYGWNVREGTRCYSNRRSVHALSRLTGGDRSYPYCPRTTADGEPLVDPIVCYPHHRDGRSFGSAVIAGYRYRGDDVPALDGTYVFGDVVGSLFAATPADRDGEMWSMETLRLSSDEGEAFEGALLAFGRDDAGELYALTSQFAPGTGAVHRLRSAER
ncbi:PQQ-dependent sugar dehydrogenase [Halogeometricum limi]|uniref:Glucose/arabinose dehydrogenase, beta-propeller fold n=1 Tax=Halogeometricum limi TaxID=555875 RepID=A0A1I6G517_9EURY|nr:PQQ-dependent sugar dehydrogenase [Halogeometricum limi]SFR37298.1 Glucose/arabinose dehydrogenase, beta-propeller fold [Halogeometricum limi]